MKTLTVTKDFLTSNECTSEILADIAVRHCKMESDSVKKLGKNGKLIGAVRKYLQDENNGYAESFAAGELQLDISVLADELPVANVAKPRASSTTLSGSYKVIRGNLNKAQDGSEKQRVYAILFECNTFEEYFAKCAQENLSKIVAQGRKNPQLVFTAQELARWAVKCKWISVA